MSIMILDSKLVALPDDFLSSFLFCFSTRRACFFFSFSRLPNDAYFAIQSILIYTRASRSVKRCLY